MKKLNKLILIAFLFFYNFLSAQAPEGVNYQAVIRNGLGNLVTNTNIAIRVQLKQFTTTGSIVYQERHTVTTTSQGLVNLVIGSGTVQLGTFSAITWGAGPYFVTLGVDFSNGTNYQDFGTQQLMSVPYALYAKNAGNQLNQWRYGSTVPATSLGNFGDFYLNVLTGNTYYKNSSNTWVLIGNNMGPQGLVGPQGPQGPQGLQGSSGTSPETLIPTNVYLLATSSTYTVPVGSIAKISNIITSSPSSFSPCTITINGATIYIADGQYYQSNNQGHQEAEKYQLIDGEIWLPSGTTVGVPNGSVSFASIQEYSSPSGFTVKLVTSADIVPANKKWRMMTFLPSTAIGTTMQYLFKINNITLVAGYGMYTNSSPEDRLMRSIIDGSVWLPSQTSIQPFTGIYGIVVLEY